jgi:hypothetical protein
MTSELLTGERAKVPNVIGTVGRSSSRNFARYVVQIAKKQGRESWIGVPAGSGSLISRHAVCT